jgi:hypothetical protein
MSRENFKRKERRERKVFAKRSAIILCAFFASSATFAFKKKLSDKEQRREKEFPPYLFNPPLSLLAKTL